MPSKFQVGLVQMSMSADPEAHLTTAMTRVKDAARQSATLVCLPELFRTLYIGQRVDLALGNLALRASDTEVGPMGTLVYWDQWYPEDAGLTALQAANMLLYPPAIGWHPAEKEQYGPQQLDGWKTIQRSHAIASGCWVA